MGITMEVLKVCRERSVQYNDFEGNQTDILSCMVKINAVSDTPGIILAYMYAYIVLVGNS